MKATAIIVSRSMGPPLCASSMKYRMIWGSTSCIPKLASNSTPSVMTNGNCGTM